MNDKLIILALPPSAFDALTIYMPIGEGEEKPLQEIKITEINIR